MSNQEQRVSTQGILEIIASLTARRASGRLAIVTGTTEGEILFTGGNLVDARLGHLTGFQAVNALAAMDDAYVEFDSSVNTPMNSSMTSSERVVLKEFFGIESVDSKQQLPAAIVDEEDETTLITSKVPNTSTEPPLPPRPRYRARRRRLNYPVIFAVSILLIALSVAAAAWLLKQEAYEQKSAPATATRTESVPASKSLPASQAVPKRESSPPSNAATTTNATTATNNDKTDRDLTGNWSVVNTVHTTSYRSFQNLRIGFVFSINQTGKTFTAKGQKITENGRSLPASERTPIQLNGAINGDRIEATFSEQGSSRKTSGRFVWKIDRAGGRLTGTFASSAARARGESTAKRQL